MSLEPGMVTNNSDGNDDNNNWVSLEQVCSWNSEQSNSTPVKQTFEVFNIVLILRISILLLDGDTRETFSQKENALHAI